MTVIDLNILSGAIFSDDRKYRYALWRVWNRNLSILMQVGLNPSTANEITGDPTITRSIHRAYILGFGAFLMANLYAYVSTNPNVLLKQGDFIGELNDYYIKQMVEMSERQLCGWGSFKPVSNRAPIVLPMLKNPYCLGINADGQPTHPLYVGYDVSMMPYKGVN